MQLVNVQNVVNGKQTRTYDGCITYKHVIATLVLLNGSLLNVLHDPNIDFADADWELLGQQLLRGSTLRTIRADRHGDPSLCLIDTASTWLQTDLNASWERLAEAIEQVATYGEKTANTVRQKTGIGEADYQVKVHTGYMCVWEE